MSQMQEESKLRGDRLIKTLETTPSEGEDSQIIARAPIQAHLDVHVVQVEEQVCPNGDLFVVAGEDEGGERVVMILWLIEGVAQ